jgi:uncharacterized membrane protein YhiD involved in acid resistance
VAQIYRRARAEPASSFTVTLLLLSVLIAMVTQVIGDNVARAFSLVGALSIVRFRTVVRDTQDTAYVIFSVAVGMAVGAASLWVAVAGMAVVAVAAFATRRESAVAPASEPPGVVPFRVQVRLGLGRDAAAVVTPVLDQFVQARRLIEVKTARQGVATDVSYRVVLRGEDQGHPLVAALNRIDGVMGAVLERMDEAESDTEPRVAR